ncbi:hypothetical protein SELMODRAFT_419986 [Selaginella moellendorffii]|uniref:Uncharacterized protein n=1 Tax=Selaginella moellendorffii TaxID=88036 RepID=D8SA71_SELML|nr:hypothetical protein SELMODRAFT_419986 [Selaginella moellendorffii]
MDSVTSSISLHALVCGIGFLCRLHVAGHDNSTALQSREGTSSPIIQHCMRVSINVPCSSCNRSHISVDLINLSMNTGDGDLKKSLGLRRTYWRIVSWLCIQPFLQSWGKYDWMYGVYFFFGLVELTNNPAVKVQSLDREEVCNIINARKRFKDDLKAAFFGKYPASSLNATDEVDLVVSCCDLRSKQRKIDVLPSKYHSCFIANNPFVRLLEELANPIAGDKIDSDALRAAMEEIIDVSLDAAVGTPRLAGGDDDHLDLLIDAEDADDSDETQTEHGFWVLHDNSLTRILLHQAGACVSKKDGSANMRSGRFAPIFLQAWGNNWIYVFSFRHCRSGEQSSCESVESLIQIVAGDGPLDWTEKDVRKIIDSTKDDLKAGFFSENNW